MSAPMAALVVGAGQHALIHTALLYVRGKWERSEAGHASMLMSKCSHDLDLIAWMKSGIRPRRSPASAARISFGLNTRLKEQEPGVLLTVASSQRVVTQPASITSTAMTPATSMSGIGPERPKSLHLWSEPGRRRSPPSRRTALLAGASGSPPLRLLITSRSSWTLPTVRRRRLLWWEGPSDPNARST